MQLREATNGDVGAVRDLVFRVLREYGLSADPAGTDADLDDIEENYRARQGAFDVLLDTDGAIVGSVGLYRVDRETCELRKMYLRREYRGRGLGRRMLEHALATAERLGYRRVTLETASALKEAIALYRRYGFRPLPDVHLSSRCDQAYSLDLRSGGAPQ